MIGRRMARHIPLPTASRAAIVALALLFSSWPAAALEDPRVSPKAPHDLPHHVVPGRYRQFVAACAPYVQKARETYPAAKKRFLAGLPAGHSFFVTIRLFDDHGHMEQVFVAVDEIRDETVSGRIWSQITSVTGYAFRDRLRFPESELIDWLITKPDGSEEGNFVGKFIDRIEPHPPGR